MKTIRLVYILILISFCSFFSDALGQTAQEKYHQTIRGTVEDKDLHMPLGGATVILLSDSTKRTITDEQGKFKLNQVNVGRHELKVIVFGYKEIVLPVLVTSGKEVVLAVGMQEEVIETEAIVIGDGEKGKPNNTLSTVSTTNLRPEEINRFAGSRNDPSRMAANYAGVAGGGDQRNDIIVRGNSPVGVLWRMEGVDIPNPNHFSFTGNTGGAFSILNNNLLSNSDFFTGAFPAEYGNKTAAVFDVKLRNGNNEKREHTVQAGLNGLELVTEGPIAKGSGASYLVSGRLLSFEALDKLGVSIGANGVPQFQDGTIKINIPTSKAGTFTGWGIAGRSTIFLKDEDFAETNKYLKYTNDFLSSMYAAGLSHSYFYGNNTSGTLTLSVSGSNVGVTSQAFYRASRIEQEDYRIRNRQGQYLANYTFTHKFNARHLLKAGIIYRIMHYNNYERYYSEDDSTYRTSWDQKGSTSLLQQFVHWQFHLTEKLTLNTGLYYQRFMLNSTQALEPRVSAEYRIDKKQKVSLASGLHSQTHDLYIYQTRFYDEKTGTYIQTNKNLGFTKSIHFVGSYQRSITPNLRLKTEAYYQHLYNVPVSASMEKGMNTFSVLNSGSSYDIFSPDSAVNKGTGRNYGVEFTLERYFNKDYYFLTTVSLLQSKYKAFDKVERNTAFNIGHVMNFLAGKEFHLDDANRKVISVDFKVTYSGGRRIVPVDPVASMKEEDTEYDYSKAYDVKVKNYFRTDIKVSYNINRPSATHNLFIAADNVFNTQNVMGQHWDSDKKKVVTDYQLGLFPYLGYRVQF